MTYEGELDEQGLVPAEAMIAGMAELTGWNLDLADEITSGPGGMTVSFADTCSIFTGPPDPQKEEFHVYDAGELAATILDSIQHTLQYNFVDPEKGEPSSLDIYYCDAAGESIGSVVHMMDHAHVLGEEFSEGMQGGHDHDEHAHDELSLIHISEPTRP